MEMHQYVGTRMCATILFCTNEKFKKVQKKLFEQQLLAQK
jgi:hypothetical protein